MSEMQFFHGYFDVSDIEVTADDNDYFYDLEEKLGCYLVKVDGVLYKIWQSEVDVDAYGFCVALGPTEHKQLMLYWYNGGASVHECAESAIRSYVNKE